MTRVTEKSWRGEFSTTLEMALIPHRVGYYDSTGGQLETLQDNLNATREVIDRLLAHMVDHGTLSLEDAASIAGNYAELEIENE